MKTATSMYFLVLALAGTALLAGPALAAEAAVDKFELMDSDKNGSVTWEEFHKNYPQMQRGAFDSIDADKNQAISRAEWDAFLAQHSMGRAASGGMGGGMGMPPKDMPGSPAPAKDAPQAPMMITPPAK